MENQTTNQQPAKALTSQASTWTSEEASFFMFEDLHPVPCEEAESETRHIEPHLYLQSLESRVAQALKASKGFTDLVEIAEAYESDDKINIRLNTTPVSSDEFDALVSGIERKDVVTVNTPLGEFEVPVPTTQAIPKYQKVLNNVAAASIKTLHDISLLVSQKGVNVAKLATEIKTMSRDAIRRMSKTVERKDVMESILTVLMVDRNKEKQIAAICDQYSKPEMWIDPLTSGLWIINPEDHHPALSAARVRKVISTYELDDNQTQSLIALAFSHKPRETAAAKLNLFSRVKGAKRDEIKRRSKEVLAIVFSETELTQSEIKAMIFSKPKDPTTICPACDVPIEIDGVTYHQRCEVIDWLVKHFFFKYDEKLGILSTQTVVFFDHNQRALLETIQQHHRTLNRPFKIKGGAKYMVMQRDGKSTRTLTNIATNPQLVPGTPEWLDKQRREAESRRRH